MLYILTPIHPAKTDVKDHLYDIECCDDHQDLLKRLHLIVNDVKVKQDKKKAVALDPSQSSQPTGARWTWEALTENIKYALGITPLNTGSIKDVLSLPINQQLTLVRAISERLLGKKYPVNDRNNTFETVMNILGQLGPDYQELITVVTQPLITTFYNDIPKPYTNYVGHQFRTADGSQNSIMFPDVGKAGSNYVRTVRSLRNNNVNLPPAKEVFDKLLKRPDDEFTEHKSGINMLLLYLAIIITHDLFHTDPSNPQRNLTTSYADLSILYGNNREQQISIRQMKGGLLKPDQWYDKRLVIQPPGVSALIVVFSRNHNYIAKKLLEINENERFSYGPGKALATEEEQDEKLFQTARLINNGCYANAILHDYVRTIIGTEADSDFFLDPLAEAESPVYGNAVSIEFNIIYRWHPAIGKQDSEWISEVMSVLGGDFGNGTSKQCPVQTMPKAERPSVDNESLFDIMSKKFNEHFVHASQEELEKGLPIAGAHRDIKTGSFPDGDIIKALKSGYTQYASEIGNGQNTPAALEHVEIAGINQARALGVCTFNEFRKFLNLTTLETFEDFSEKPSVQQALKELYGTPDCVELYTGLMVERTKVTGLRLPYTMSRAILSDAVNLLRGDRILARELTPTNLTNWGYEYILGDPNANKRVLPEMLIKLFPDVHPSSGGFTPQEVKKLFITPEFTHKGNEE
ncbi:hypothetical protein G6F46_007530 [Rhizopus delemar]|nr:hypothetical protein G6F55_004597 [Rhizopus delemar]KAG1541719.1 hypothetical protein G6F51_007718 [Rhizopus arrhizus]KAG1498839.1 hypothetical protein G6F54_004798 [Rhizopus delemar]KAG1509686.1 hypothetical protein G6F53_007252 [Rhizopus delemar]KAG1526052.1 hypothetical protein G6F52_002777 [Rhizopus delemar]